MKHFTLVLVAAVLMTSACKKADATNEAPATGVTSPAADGAPDAAPRDVNEVVSPQSEDILARTSVTDHAVVRHVLVSSSANAAIYGGRGGQDARGAERSENDMRALAADILKKANDGADFVALMREYSEDPGSARTGREYTATPNASLVEPFKALALRLELNETGVVETDFGFHIIQRTQ